MSDKWYVLHSKPNMENMLWNQLLVRNVSVYFPRLNVKPVNPRSRTLVPYFPGYLFANLDLAQIPLSKLAWIPGMQRIVSFDGEPAWVSDSLISILQKQVELANQNLKDPTSGFQPGDPVRIQSGPFAGYDAIFDARLDGTQRARVLIKFLRDQQVRMLLPVNQLARLPQRG